ncbi:hypothetical protein PspLS_05872 [Pyricularia sp. CBS 133598]|nr:hypothetical protein PspLS_05872 [Pyricularia sp. CBS 133598]
MLCTKTCQATISVPKSSTPVYVLVSPEELLVQQISTTNNALRFSVMLVTIKETFWCAVKNQVYYAVVL